MSYKTLEVWKIAREVSVEIHLMSIRDLPKHEMFETGSQIRRSSASIRSNIVEGYGRKKYRADYCRFIVYALASNDETIDHLDKLFETRSLKDRKKYDLLLNKLNILGRKLNKFLQRLEGN